MRTSRHPQVSRPEVGWQGTVLLALVLAASLAAPAMAQNKEPTALFPEAEVYLQKYFRWDVVRYKEPLSQLVDRYVELRGTLFAVGESGGVERLFMRPTDSAPVLIEAQLEAGRILDELPFLEVSSRCRLLCQIKARPGSPPVLEVKAAVDEFEAEVMDRIHELRVLGKKAAPAAPGAPAMDVVGAFTKTIKKFRPQIPDAEASEYASIIHNACAQHQVDGRLVLAMIGKESRFNPNARSRVGAQGLGQLMPATAEFLMVRNPYDAKENLEAAIRYLGSILRQHSGVKPRLEQARLALAGYNAGPRKARTALASYPETQGYVEDVLRWFLMMVPPEERKEWE